MGSWLKRQMHKISSFYAAIVIRHPRLGLVVLLAIPIVLAAIGIVAYPIEIDTTATAFIPRGSGIGRVEQSVIVGEENTRFNPLRDPSDTDSSPTKQQSERSYALTAYFWDKKGGNVLTEERVALLRELENEIFSHPDYPDVCYIPRTSTACSRPMSVTRYIYASPVENCTGLYSPDGANDNKIMPVEDALLRAIDPSQGVTYCSPPDDGSCATNCSLPDPNELNLFVSNGFGFENSSDLSSNISLASDVTKTIIYFGLPLEGYANSEDRTDEQIKVIEDLVRKLEKNINDKDGDLGLHVLPLSAVTINDHFQALIVRDTLPVIASIVIVWLYMWFHTQSFFMASLGMLHVVLSFPVTYLILQVFLNVGAMGVLNFMALFIILGIGADDIFIFVDAWKQSAHEIPRKGRVGLDRFGDVVNKEDENTEENLEWLEQRLMWAHRRSAKAMLITSLTTGAAFLMNLSSDIPAIQVFGFFTGIMIFINYLEVITFFPFVVIVQQRWLRHNKSCICFGLPCDQHSSINNCRNNTDEDDADQSQPQQSMEMHVKAETPKPDLENGPQATQSGSPAESKQVRENIDNYRAIERFFHNVFSPFIVDKKFLILTIFAIWFALTMAFAVQLEADDEPTQWVPKDDPIRQTIDLEEQKFARSESKPQIWVVHGLALIDQSGTNPFNPNSIGKVRFDDGFDVSSTAAQQEYINMCERLRLEKYVLDEEVLCPMEEIRDYYQDVLGQTFPIPQQDFIDVVVNYTVWYESINGPAPDYSDGSQDAESRSQRRQSLAAKSQIIRFALSDPPELQYMATVVNSTLNIRSSASQIRPVYKHWQGVIQRENSDPDMIQATLDDGFQTTDKYIDIQVEDTLLEAAVVGIAASLSLAFVIILLSTRDIVISVYSILAIGLTVVSLIAVIVWLGWKLSIIESICLTILVGLSVDYVIHLANAYRESKFRTRAERVQDALTVMGISVLSASITTFLSAIILFTTYILFFFKFGVFISLTILLSSIFAFFFFMSLLAAAGRKEKHNDFTSLWHLITCKKADEDHDVAEDNSKSRSTIAFEKSATNGSEGTDDVHSTRPKDANDVRVSDVL